MAVQEFDTQEELDEAFEQLEELAMEHMCLRDAVEEARRDLEYAEEELRNFETDNKDLLIS
jgi:outer membrane protein TolC